MRTSILAALLTVFTAVPLLAQQPPQPPAQPRPTPQPSSFTNIRLDLTITDTYAETPSTKTVTMLVMDGERGSVRTANRLPGSGVDVQLNVDAIATLLPDRTGRIRLRLTFEFTPAQSTPPDARPVGPAELTESLTVVLEDGKKLVISQSADPLTDRRVTVEVSATVQK
jgi:hypothetical protein